MGKVEEAAEIRRCRGRDVLEIRLPGAGHDRGDVRKKRGFIPPRPGPGAQVAGKKIGTVGLDDETRTGNRGEEREKMRSAALVTDPAGESDGEPLRQQGLELGGGARETVDEGAFGGKSRLAPEREEVGVRLAHVEKERSSAALRKRELRGEGALLLRARTQETEVVEPTLADADHSRVVEEPLETAESLVRPRRGVVRMTARGHPHPGGMTAVEIRGPEALLEG